MKYIWIFVISVIVCFPVLRWAKEKIKTCSIPVRSAAQLASAVVCVGLLVICMILLVSSNNNPFLYFRF